MKPLLTCLALVLTLLACQQTNSIKPPENVLGTMRVRFVLEPSAKGAVLRPQVLSEISANSPGGVQMQLLSTNTFTFGPRGAGGQRFVSATYAVRNADVGGKAYPNANSNISFLAVSTPNSLIETAIGEMQTYGGTPVAQALLAQAFKPTHAMRYDFTLGLPEVAPGGEDFQVFDESEVSGFATADISPLNYGFVVRSPSTPNSRTLPANPAKDDFFGTVTFAMRFPLQASAAQDPFAFAMDFLVVTDNQTRVTQSLEQQSTNKVSSLATSLTGAVVNTLPGSSYGATPTRFVQSVRLAKAPNNNPVFLVQAVQNILVSSNADVAANGAITLRQAINQIATGGTIDLSFINGQTITLSSSLVVGRDVTITNTASSPNVVIRGGTSAFGANNVRVLEVQSGVTATIRHVSIENGTARGAPARGGGILNAGNLTLENCKFRGNQAIGDTGANATDFEGGSGANAQGGAIHNAGTLSIGTSSFTNNKTIGGQGGNGIGLRVPPIGGPGGAGGNAEGGAVYNASGSTLSISGTSFNTNNATGGRGGNGGTSPTSGNTGPTGLGGNANGGAGFNAGTVNFNTLTFGTAANANSVTVGAGSTSSNPPTPTALNPNTNF